ncbi:MAG: MerR family transcriptional regulator, partial [Clostridia bacterium]|nr:MerR family transcriptional regulator [Clostridia bacterium]
MRIGKVEEVTGLSRKTIRFYEEKGLLKVKRKDNSYREYDEETIKNLNYIILFRRAGISLGNVELWQDGVIGTEEMLSGRLSELKNAAALNGSQARLCLRMTEALRDDGLSESVLRAFLAEGKETEDVLEETGEAVAVGEGESLSLGLDIGTTTVSAAVVSLSTGKSLQEYT